MERKQIRNAAASVTIQAGAPTEQFDNDATASHSDVGDDVRKNTRRRMMRRISPYNQKRSAHCKEDWTVQCGNFEFAGMCACTNPTPMQLCKWPEQIAVNGQKHEDAFVFENYFCGKKNGVYLELGATDGHLYSNTINYERHFNWSGILIEAGPAGKEIERNRNRSHNHIINQGVCSGRQGAINALSHGGASDIWGVENGSAVACQPLSSMLQEARVQHIDFFSLDVEGHELEVLETMDWNIPVGVWLVELWATAGVSQGRLDQERNYGRFDPEKDQKVVNLLERYGYVQTGIIDCNVIFEHRSIRNNRENGKALYSWEP